MRRNIDIFVKTEKPLRELAHILRGVLGSSAQPHDDPFIYGVFSSGGDVYVTLGIHELLSDEELNFEDYPYMIAVETHGTPSPKRNKRQDKIAYAVYDYLKKTQRYELMAVRDVETLLARYTPGTAAPATR